MCRNRTKNAKYKERVREMKLSEIREDYEELSGLLSRFNRQLAFAGIGIVWLFRATDKTGSTSIDPQLLTPVLCFVISFGFDLLQYFWQSLVWYIYYWFNRNKGIKEDTEMNEPEWPNIVAWLMFIIKVSALMAAYLHLGMFLYGKLFV